MSISPAIAEDATVSRIVLNGRRGSLSIESHWMPKTVRKRALTTEMRLGRSLGSKE